MGWFGSAANLHQSGGIVKGQLTLGVPGTTFPCVPLSDDPAERDLVAYMNSTCPCCGLTLTEAALRCPLCNERLMRFDFRARHLLSVLLALEICVALLVLT